MPTVQAKRLQLEPPVTARNQAAQNLALQILRVLLIVGLVVGALELSFAAAGVGEQEYLKPDPQVGFIGMPNKRVTWRSEGFSRTSFNQYGMNDVPRSKQKTSGKTRVAVLGDSFVEALQVDRAQNFCALVEKQIPSCEMLNFGSSAYNLGQVYLRLKHQAADFKPDVVVVAIDHNSVFNLVPNPRGGFLSARPVFYIDGNKGLLMTRQLQEDWLHSKESQRIRNTSWLREHSRIWGVISLAAQDIAGAKPFESAAAAPESGSAQAGAPAVSIVQPASQSAKDANQLKATRYYWPLAESLILSIKKECGRLGAKLIIVRLPASGMISNPVETAMLAETARKHGIDLLETDEQAKAAAQQGQKLFYSAHLAPQGHALVADMLAPRIKNLRSPDSI